MSEGKEYFKAGINLDQFDKDIVHIKGSFTDIGKAAEIEGARIDNSLKQVGVTIAGIFTLQKAQQFASDVAKIRGEFQQLEIAFETMLGSKAKTDALMRQLVDTAAKTPFDLTGVANGAKQLLAYGTASEEVNDTLIKLGNIASGLNIPLNELVYLYGTSRVQGRMFHKDIYQFMGRGIPIIKELSEVLNVTEDKVMDLVSAGKVGFPELQQVINNLTKQGGMFFNLMEKQSASITGQIANLEDAYDVMLNNIGQKSEGAFGSAIDMATMLVENYETVGNVLASIIAIYGTYKAAIMAVNFVQSLQTKIALESALAGKTLTLSQGVQAVATKNLNRAQLALNKSMLANPYVLATMAVVGLGYAMYKLITHTSDLAQFQAKLTTEINKESSSMNELFGKLKDTNKGTTERKSIVEELTGKYGEYLTGLDLEKASLEEITKAQKEANAQLDKSIRLRLLGQRTEEIKDSYNENIQKGYSKFIDQVTDMYGTEVGARIGARLETKIRESIETGVELSEKDFLNEIRQDFDNGELDKGFLMKNYNDLHGYLRGIKVDVIDMNNELSITELAANATIDELNKLNKPTIETKESPVANLAEQTQQAREEVAKLTQELSDLMSGKTSSENYAKDIDEKAKELKLAEEKLNLILYGKTSLDAKSSNSSENIDTRIANNKIKAALDARAFELDNESKRIALMEDGFEKEQKLIENNHQKELLAIQRRAQELIEQQQQAEKDIWEKNGSKGTFKATTANIQDLPNNYQSELVEAENIANKKRLYDTEELNKKLLAKYRDFAARKLEVEKQFDSDLEALNKLPDSSAKSAAITQLEKDRKEAIKSISEEESAELVKTTDVFVRLFTDASEQSIKEIRKIIYEVQDLYDYLTKTKSEDLSDNFGFTAEQLRNFKGDATQLKAILDGLIAKKKGLGDKSPFESFKQGMSEGLKKLKKGDEQDVGLGIQLIGKSVQQFLPSVKEFGDNLGSMFGDSMAENIGNVVTLLDGAMDLGVGVGQMISGDIVGGMMSAVQGLSKVFGKASQVAKEHKEALRRLDLERLEQQRKYNLLLMEQNMLLKEAASIFGSEEIRKAANYIDVYKNALNDLDKEIKGDKPTHIKVGNKGFQKIIDKQYAKALAKYQTGRGKLASAEIVDGSHKSGWGPWKKRKDTYKSILQVYPELIDSEGKLDKAMLDSILSTRKMSDATRAYLEDLKNLAEQAEKAEDALRDYLSSTFGDLGQGSIQSIVDSIKDGTDAWVEFGKVGSSVIERLGEQLAYELFFANKFKKLQSDLERIYGSEKSSETIVKEAMDLVGSFYQNIGSNMNMAQDWMLNWKEEAKKAGFDLWENQDKLDQSSSKGYSITATQDQAGEGLGRLTSIQMSLTDVTEKVNNLIVLDVERNNLMKAYVIQFDEIRNLSLQIVFYLESMSKDTKYLPLIYDRVENINKNTKYQ